MNKTAFQLAEYLKYWLVKEDQYSLQSPFVYKRYCGLLDYLNQESNAGEIIKSKKQNTQDQSRKILSFDDRSKTKFEDKNLGFTGQKTRFQLLCQYFCSLTLAGTSLEIRKNLTNQEIEIKVGPPNLIFSGIDQETQKNNSNDNQSKKALKIIAEDVNFDISSKYALSKSVDFGIFNKGLSGSEIIAYFLKLEPILEPKSILIISNIHENQEISRAWHEIISQKKVKLSIDFYVCGILFFEYPSEKKNFVLDF